MINNKHRIVINKKPIDPRRGGKQTSIPSPADVVDDNQTQIIKVSADLDDVSFVRQCLEEQNVEEEESQVDDRTGYYIVVDFEATCDRGKKIPMDEMEIIEFAAVALRKETLSVEGEFNMFVQPALNPKLTNYCKKLTKISQEDIDNAFSFQTVLRQFSTWLKKFEGTKTFCSWGQEDETHLRRDCDLHNESYPFVGEHIDAKELFSEAKGYRIQYGLSAALNKAKLKFEGSPHRAIDDAKNVVRIMKKILA